LIPDGNKKHERKRDWLMSWYKRYTLADGRTLWPPQLTDFASAFLKADMWDDALERAIAFKLIGTHRTVPVDMPGQNSELRYVNRVAPPADTGVRPHFGKLGADMFFDQDGLPRVIQTPEGDLIQRGDRDWQYWKFVWRSSLLTSITLSDHLFLTHFNVASTLAEMTRIHLRPDHPMRRFLSVFTFGTIFVNINAIHALIGPNHMFHRASPFKEFTSLPHWLPDKLPTILEQHKMFRNKTLLASQGPMLTEAPYYKDGQLLYDALSKLMKDFMDVHHSDFCTVAEEDKPSVLREPQLLAFWEGMTSNERAFADMGKTTSCDTFTEALTATLFSVTGYHSHVGAVYDYFSDPDLVGSSWKDGESFARPKQSLIFSAIVAFTGATQPQITEDFTHVFNDINKEEESKVVWRSFMEEIQDVEVAVKDRNAAARRAGEMEYRLLDPSIVECAVAK